LHQNRHLLFNRSNSKVTLALLCTFIEIITQYVLCLFAIIAKIKSVPLVCIWDFWCNSAHPEQRRKNLQNHKILYFCFSIFSYSWPIFYLTLILFAFGSYNNMIFRSLEILIFVVLDELNDTFVLQKNCWFFILLLL